MNEAGAANHAEQPLFDSAAMRDALAALRGSAGTGDVLRLAGSSPGEGDAGAPAASEPAALPPKTVSQVLGEITWLMTQSPRHKAIPLGDLEWLLMPAILLRQFRIFYNGEQPVGVALWALADDLAAKRIDAGDNRLSAVEWKSGSNMRIVELVAPFGGEAEIRKQISCL
ncbi:MAG: cytolysin-activating lysine-acyltransferase [Bradyrhizobium sp.]|nr:cytolysin-activating lysine-acyltransferase [Bradyrhizobium sp.]